MEQILQQLLLEALHHPSFHPTCYNQYESRENTSHHLLSSSWTPLPDIVSSSLQSSRPFQQWARRSTSLSPWYSLHVADRQLFSWYFSRLLNLNILRKASEGFSGIIESLDSSFVSFSLGFGSRITGILTNLLLRGMQSLCTTKSRKRIIFLYHTGSDIR